MSKQANIVVEYLPLAKLLPYAKNSRTHSDDQVSQIAASIKEFGFTNPILISDESDIIAGHGRAKAAHLLAMKLVPCIRLGHLSAAQRKAYVIADNRLALNAGWDSAMLTLELQDLKAEDFNLDILGFDDDELAALLNPELAPAEGLTDPDAVPEDIETRCKLGDLWVLGKHRLLCGDSTNVQHVERLMDGQKGELLLTDPPYGVSYVEKNAAVHGGVVKNAIGKKITNDSGTVEEMGKLWSDLFALAFCFSNTASYYVFSPQGGELMMMMQAIHQSDWQLKHSLIWQKQNFVFGRCDYHYQHEPVLYGWKKKGTHHWYADHSQSSLLQFDKPHRSDLHPTTKPVDILEYLIGNSSKVGDLVVDFFSGSGSTLIACEKTNRRCFGMEIDPHYCDVILKRWEDFTGKQAVLESQDG